MRRRSSLALAGLAIAMAVCAQQPAQDIPTADFRSRVRLVALPAAVVNKDGELLTDLPQSAFTVLENNVVQAIKLFTHEDVPVSMGLVIDNSGSMLNKRARVAAAALAFVKASNREDEVFIVNFADKATLDVPFTNDVKRLEAALAHIAPTGGTAMRDAIGLALDTLKAKATHDKKVLLVITDGDDTASAPEATMERVTTQAQQSQVLVYTVGLLSEEDRTSARRATVALRGLAQATGGQSYFPTSVTEIDQIASQVAQEIRSQYVLGYSPANDKLDGAFRRIQVNVKAPGKPQVRTRSGYYATPEYYGEDIAKPGARPGTN